LAWLAPHALSLIIPVIVMVAADANEHSPPTKPVRTKPLQMFFTYPDRHFAAREIKVTVQVTFFAERGFCRLAG
jgi:hypothetical protein